MVIGGRIQLRLADSRSLIRTGIHLRHFTLPNPLGVGLLALLSPMEYLLHGSLFSTCLLRVNGDRVGESGVRFLNGLIPFSLRAGARTRDPLMLILEVLIGVA
jgi:hypothetical protein